MNTNHCIVWYTLYFAQFSLSIVLTCTKVYLSSAFVSKRQAIEKCVVEYKVIYQLLVQIELMMAWDYFDRPYTTVEHGIGGVTDNRRTAVTSIWQEKINYA